MSRSLAPKKKAETLSTAVTPKVAELVRELAEEMGITVSEYLRRLILDDLDRRTVFTGRLKGAKP